MDPFYDAVVLSSWRSNTLVHELTAQLAPATGSYGNNILDWAAPALYC
ncbi:hypothetical protein [Klenkia sp. PcliD-1-E]|nr:hypothetical protein [Klenkia sp. PcliD-1-E]MCO7218998.1 hypothetical protein [Klenkia sp. PcliD-1-E]